MNQHFSPTEYKLHKRYAALDAFAFKATKALYLKASGRAPRMIGCCILFQVDQEKFLLSAAHVLHKAKDKGLFIGTRSGLASAPGSVVILDPDHSLHYDNASLDVAVLQLPNNWNSIPENEFITLADTAARDWMYPTNNYLVFGYPTSATRFNANLQHIAIDTRKYIGQYRPDVTSALGLTPQTHVAVEFNHKRMITSSGIQAVNHPAGMSGCGIWSLPEWDDPYTLTKGKLVAIMTDYKQKRGVIVGPRIAYHFHTMRTKWPELCRNLPTLGLPDSVV